MAWYNIFTKKKKAIEERGVIGDYISTSLGYNGQTTYKNSNAMLLSAVYRCVEVISDSVAQLPIYVFKVDNDGFKTRHTKHATYYLLNKEPNHNMTRFTFIKSLITSMLLNGNGYAYIDRDGVNGTVKGIYFLRPEYVTLNYDAIKYNGEVEYQVTGIGKVSCCNMIHLVNFSYNGIEGISTLTHARNTLTLAADEESYARGFFESGAALSGILKVDAPLTAKQKADIRSSWQGAFGSGSGQQNGIAVLEGTMDFQSISVDPQSSELLSSRLQSVTDICRYFGVSPVKAFDLSKSSYSTVEATQLAFLTDTLAPLLEKIELEFERKLFLPSERKRIEVKFDTAVLLRADKTSQAAFYTQLFNIGVYSPNEIRKELDLPSKDGLDVNVVQVNMTSVKSLDKPQETATEPSTTLLQEQQQPTAIADIKDKEKDLQSENGTDDKGDKEQPNSESTSGSTV